MGSFEGSDHESKAVSPQSRVSYSGDFGSVIDRLCAAYGIGASVGYSVIDRGYEDCNVLIRTAEAKYVAKIFAKRRIGRRKTSCGMAK